MYMQNLVVTILAGGLGKRMKSDLPKVLHMFGDKPMIVCILLECLKLNLKKIVVITGKFDKLIRDTIKKYLSDYSFQKIKFVVQETPLGTGHAIRCALPLFEDNEKIIILNGDMPLIDSELIKKFFNFTENNCLLVAKLENPHGYGRILIEGNNFIRIVEQKDCNDEEKNINIINSGLYKINGYDLKNYIPLIENNNNQKEFYLTDICELLINDGIDVKTFLINENENKLIMGVNSKEELEELLKEKERKDKMHSIEFNLEEDGFKRSHLYT